MREKCQQCEADINGTEQDCPACGFRVYEAFLIRTLGMCREAIVRWETMSKQLKAEVLKLGAIHKETIAGWQAINEQLKAEIRLLQTGTHG